MEDLKDPFIYRDPSKLVDRQIEELRRNVTELEFNSTQFGQEEEAGTGRYYDFFQNGSYHCVVCNEYMLDSEDKERIMFGYASFTRVSSFIM